MNDTLTTPEMLADYNRKSRAYRFTIFVLLCFIASMGVWLIVDARNYDQRLLQINKDTKSLIQGQVDNAKERDRAVSQVRNSVLCFIAFLGVPDRANLYISNVDTCTLTNKTSGATTQLPLIPVTATPTLPKV